MVPLVIPRLIFDLWLNLPSFFVLKFRNKKCQREQTSFDLLRN
jgi:hypothetical protein